MLKLYGMQLSPFYRKAFIGLEEKGLKYEEVYIIGGDETPEYRAISPWGKVPALTDGEFSVSDSTAILNYLDAISPTPPLYPASPQAKARTVWFEEFADTILIRPGAAIFFNRIVKPKFFNEPGDEDAVREAVEETAPACFDYLESQLPGCEYFVRDQFSAADIAVACIMMNMDWADFPPAKDRWPNLARWFEGILKRKSFKTALAAAQETLKAA